VAPDGPEIPEGTDERLAKSLAPLVRQEAARMDAEDRIAPDPERIAAGWDRRFVIEHGRTADLVALYERGGFEVVLDPVAPELLADECTDCKLVSALQYVQVYVRRR